MSEKLVKELEDYLVPYVHKRFDISQSALGGLAKTLMGNLVKQGENYAIWVVRAFIRCLLSADRPIYLKDITSVALAEAYVMMRFTPMKHPGIREIENLAGQQVLMESEVHHWLIHLQEIEKLPGTYNRFTGLYESDSI
jgi:hypothetical protein